MSVSQPAQLLAAAQQYLRMGQPSMAVDLLRRAAAAAPALFQAHAMLATTLQSMGNTDAAIEHLQSVLGIFVDWADGHQQLGAMLAAAGKFEQAALEFGKVVRLRPNNVEALNDLGSTLKSSGRLNEAIETLRRAVLLRPDQAEIHNNLGHALITDGQVDEGFAELHTAVSLKPLAVNLYQGLTDLLVASARIPQAIEVFRAALQRDPTHPHIHSGLLMALHYNDASDADPRSLLEEHIAFDRQHIAALPRGASFANHRDPEKRLRIGYLSPDFRRHSASHFIEPLLAAHDRSRFEIHCYADSALEDSVTDRLRASVDHWRKITGQSDEQAADLIRSDQIDILIDLSGHSAGNRMLLLGRKPAPVQATYLGYPDITGLRTMDYRMTDTIADPPDAPDVPGGEKLFRIDPPFLCYRPPDDAPEVTEAPVLKTGQVTFGSFNNPAKVSPTTIRLWAAAMRGVPGSHLLMKFRFLEHPQVCAPFISGFEQQGIEPHRLRFTGFEGTTASHLARYADVDIALDPYPYNGTTTTCDALWMGVPVVTCPGRIHAARVGASILTAIGRRQWIARDQSDFADITAELTRDPARLNEQRRLLRDHVRSTALVNGPDFARRFEFALRTLWRTYCAS